MVVEEKIRTEESTFVSAITQSGFMCEECGTRVDKLRNFCGFGICEDCYLKLLFKNQREI